MSETVRLVHGDCLDVAPTLPESSVDLIVVFDPFAGSFALGKVCQEEDRRYIGIEKDERYYKAGCRRIAQAQNAHPLFAEGA